VLKFKEKKEYDMLNQVVLVGRLTKDLETHILEDGRKVSTIYVAVQRPYKNVDGNYDTDFVKCSVWEGLSTLIEPYCQKGTMIALKGRIQSYKKEIQEKSYTMIEVVAERISYLKDTKESIETEDKNV
jgi:single-strand DNA-binding protein